MTRETQEITEKPCPGCGSRKLICCGYKPPLDPRDGAPGDPEWDIEVTWTKRVIVRAKTSQDAIERALERAPYKLLEGESPDSEDTEIMSGPDQDDDEEG